MQHFRTELPYQIHHRNQEILVIPSYNASMTDAFAPLLALLNGTLVPRLQEIQASQDEQRLQADRLERALVEIRSTMVLHFAEIRIDLAACQARMEDILVTLNENDAAGTPKANLPPHSKKSLPN
jgi:hypothetical protein